MKKSVAENEEYRTGAQIAFVKLARLIGRERVEKMNPDN